MKAISWLLFSLFVSSIVLSFSLYPQDDTPHFLKKWLQTAYLEDPQLSKEKLTQHLISLQQQLQATPTLRGFRFFSPTGELLYQYPETLYPLDPFPKNSFDSLSFFRDSWTLQRPSSTFTCIAEWVLSPAPLLPYAWICCLLLSAISGVLACFLFLPLPPPNHSPTQTPLVLEKSMEFRPGIAEELEKSNQFLTDLIGKIKDSLKDIRDFQFTSNAAHELRTPLTTIRGELELLQLRPQDFTPQRLTPVMEEIDRLNKLCNSLLLLTRLDEEKENVHKNKVSLHYILSHVFEQMWPLADENQIQLTL
jgi:signal transduction histidine kinase